MGLLKNSKEPEERVINVRRHVNGKSLGEEPEAIKKKSTKEYAK
jgi:hypothetical protein